MLASLWLAAALASPTAPGAIVSSKRALCQAMCVARVSSLCGTLAGHAARHCARSVVSVCAQSQPAAVCPEVIEPPVCSTCPTGPVGPVGPSGPEGPAGPAGVAGTPGAPGQPGTVGTPGPTGPTGTTGATGSAAGPSVVARTAVMTVLRPDNGAAVAATALCLPGEQATGGGTIATASDPRNAEQLLMQENGPTPGSPVTGWFGQAAPTTRFNQGSTLTVTVTVLCAPQ